MTRTKCSMLVGTAIALAIAGAGCSGSDGSQGPQGPQGIQGPQGTAGLDAVANGTLAGTVKDAYGNLVSGAKVTFTVANEAATVATANASGAYAVAFPPGARTVTFSATGYVAFAQTVEIRPAQTSTLNVTLNPNDRVAVNVAAAAVNAAAKGPGSQWTLTPSVAIFDPALRGQTVTYQWSVTSGPPATFSSATAQAPTVTLASRAEFKKTLVELAAPRFTYNPDEPPINVDRYQVVPLSYEQALSQGNATKLKLVATVGGVPFSTTVTVAATLPFQPSTGLANVPVNAPVVLQGQFPFKDANGAYVFTPELAWTWAVSMGGAAVAVSDASSAYPDFVPTTAGEYVVTQNGVEVLRVFADQYAGAMAGAGVRGCGACHAATFTAWLQTGHKEVIWNGIEELPPGGHYAKTCTPCHTVGNGGLGAGGYADKIAAVNPDFATTLQGNALAEQVYWRLYPNSAPLAGVQCENCHGPNGSAHTTQAGAAAAVGTARVSFSSSTCATCHARAPKHGRYPQWLKSGHSSFATFTYNSAADGSLSKGCACCHSAQGFAAFTAALPTAGGNRNATVLPAGLTIRNAQPITCPTCHVSHDEGALLLHEEEKGVLWTNLAKVGPTEGSTYVLPSGFAATGVGKGALCIACHNSRNAYVNGVGAFLHEDGDPQFGSTIVFGSYSAPHEACQGDVLMGRNAYFLGRETYASPATRSRHSYITNTCVTCHMELTEVFAGLGEEGQTRHDFRATPEVCNQCHTAYSAESLGAAFDERLDLLKSTLGQAILRLKSNDDPAYLSTTVAKLVANRSGQVDVWGNGAYAGRWFINNKTGQDAFLTDRVGNPVQGCTAAGVVDGLPAFDCTGFLAGAPGLTGLGAGTNGAVSASGVNQIVYRALWNAVLVQDDASRGIHNPSFTFEVIDRSIQHATTFAK